MQHEVMPSQEIGAAGGVRFLDGLADGRGRVRLFLGGLAADAVAAPGLDEIRQIAGGLRLAAPGGPGPFPLALADGSHHLLPVTADGTARFADKRVLLVLRVGESPAQLAEILLWHAQSHGAEAALVVNRAPGDAGAAFARDLAALTGDHLLLTVADLSLPSGEAGAGPETHPCLAPDAPGKGRMARPDPDPWRAPLTEGILYDWMKWRYLARARSVVSLEACDILPAATGAAVVEQAEAGGILALAGRRAYPWRVRPGAEPRAGDHICRMFDTPGGALRWAVAPGRVDPDAIWRARRIPGLRPAMALPFWRAMALRVSEAGGLPLAPKSSLIEDEGLIALSRALGARPVRPPASAAKPATAPAAAGQRIAIVTTMKNEGPFILEWLAWHRMIGVTDFLIYTNDCTDGTDRMLQLLMAKGLVEWRDNPYRAVDLKPQHAALQAAEDEAVIRHADWSVCMDVDEFINIRIGDGTLAALFAAMEQALPGANMIAMTWRLFGNSEIHGFDDRFVIDQFTRCAREVTRKPHQAWGFKTLFRNIEIYRKLGVHRPRGLKPDLWEEVRWLNGSGRRLPKEMFRNGWRSGVETYGYDWVQLNHYAVRSAESFLVKRDRGRVNHVDRDQGLHYWFRMNHNIDEDGSIRRMLPALRAEWDRLTADPEIRAAHAACVAAHRGRIAELRATADHAAFYDELTGARMERLCRLQPHFGSAVFNAGPGAIPADLDLTDPPEDFFFTTDYDGEQQH